MADVPAHPGATERMTCPQCGQVHDATPEYLADFAGQETACAQCGAPMRVPGLPRVLDYRGPKTPTQLGQKRHWRDADLLVMESGARLPDICVRCGADAPRPKVIYVARWSEAAAETRSTQASVLLFLLSHRKRRVAFGLCPRHKRLRRLAIAVGWAFMAFAQSIAVVAPSTTLGTHSVVVYDAPAQGHSVGDYHAADQGPSTLNGRSVSFYNGHAIVETTVRRGYVFDPSYGIFEHDEIQAQVLTGRQVWENRHLAGVVTKFWSNITLAPHTPNVLQCDWTPD